MATPWFFLALAAGIVISCGLIDVSTGALLSWLGMLIILVSNEKGGTLTPIWLLLMPLVIAVACSLLMAFVVIHLQVPSFITTLAFGFMFRSLSQLVLAFMSGTGPFVSTHGVNTTSGYSMAVGPEFYPLLRSPTVMVAVAFIVWFSLFWWRMKTTAGLQHIALGLNAAGARLAGVRQRRVIYPAFAMAGTLVTLAILTMLLTTQRGGWGAGAGLGMELVSIAIAVLGGCQLSGGYFSPFGIALAAVLMQALRDTVFSLKWPSETEYLILGILIIAIPIVQRLGAGARRSGRRLIRDRLFLRRT
jgi:ribose/xylose/arabinose/galactoside ABC-type transport system permease subunit